MNSFIWKNKYVRHIASFTTDWASKTTNLEAGTNFKDVVGLDLWNKITDIKNKNKYVVKIYTSSTASGTAFQNVVDCYNLLDNKSDKIFITGQQVITGFDFDDPATAFKIEVSLMINYKGEVKFNVKFADRLNANFKIPNFDLYYVE